MNRLKEKYNKEIVPALTEKYGYTSVMNVPKLDKIVVNMGVGDATTNSKLLEAAMADMAKITGQKPVATHAKKAIASSDIVVSIVLWPFLASASAASHPA